MNSRIFSTFGAFARFVAPALLAATAFAGTLGVSSVASAEEREVVRVAGPRLVAPGVAIVGPRVVVREPRLIAPAPRVVVDGYAPYGRGVVMGERRFDWDRREGRGEWREHGRGWGERGEEHGRRGEGRGEARGGEHRGGRR